jgi:Mg2+ and Co2+ transporter CorA
LSHAWHFNALFPDANTPLRPETFLYLVIASTWYTNLRFLDQDIKHIGFKEIRNPNAAINNRLHDRREDLISLREQVELASDWIPQSVNDELTAIKALAQKDQCYIGLPNQLFLDILKRSELLEKFLMDSFNLLISTTSVMEAELAIEQGIRGQRLTTLASLYIPLSFVTGVFGMNVKEINGSPLSVWVSVVALGIIAVVTAAIFVGYTSWESLRPRRNSVVLGLPHRRRPTFTR